MKKDYGNASQIHIDKLLQFRMDGMDKRSRTGTDFISTRLRRRREYHHAYSYSHSHSYGHEEHPPTK